MVEISGIKVDIVGAASTLSMNWAVFTVEFEYDSKLMVCHTFEWTVAEGIEKLVQKIMSDRVEGLDLRQAFINSEYITVEVKNKFEGNYEEIMRAKYNLISSNKTYYPMGYNFLLLVNNSIEKPYAFCLYNALINNVTANNKKWAQFCKPQRRGRVSRPVYKYDVLTGIFISEYNSVKEAAQAVNISATNINMCCNGHIKSAAGFLWSYEKVDAIENTPAGRKKAEEVLKTKATKKANIEAIVKKQKEITDRLNKEYETE